MILVSSDDKVGSTTPPQPLVPLSHSSEKPGSGPAPCPMEVILVLDSDEKDVSAKGLAKGLAMKGPKVEEHEVRIKKEPGVEDEMDSHSST